MTIQDDLRKLTTGGPGVTHIASETLFNDAADEIDALRATVARLTELLRETNKCVYECCGCIGHHGEGLQERIDAAIAEQVRT